MNCPKLDLILKPFVSQFFADIQQVHSQMAEKGLCIWGEVGKCGTVVSGEWVMSAVGIKNSRCWAGRSFHLCSVESGWTEQVKGGARKLVLLSQWRCSLIVSVSNLVLGHGLPLWVSSTSKRMSWQKSCDIVMGRETRFSEWWRRLCVWQLEGIKGWNNGVQWQSFHCINVSQGEKAWPLAKAHGGQWGNLENVWLHLQVMLWREKNKRKKWCVGQFTGFGSEEDIVVRPDGQRRLGDNMGTLCQCFFCLQECWCWDRKLWDSGCWLQDEFLEPMGCYDHLKWQAALMVDSMNKGKLQAFALVEFLLWRKGCAQQCKESLMQVLLNIPQGTPCLTNLSHEKNWDWEEVWWNCHEHG